MQKVRQYRTENCALGLAIEAPAKVNLHLAVGDKRHDGFHNLESIFLALDFCDTLYFEPLDEENSLEIIMGGIVADLPDKENIIFKAVSLFRDRAGFNQGLRIRVDKRIPVGSGMGGGSSNAASTLLALNMLASDGNGLFGRDFLADMAVSLGSDIPFFLCETGAAWVTGRGDIISRIQAPRDIFLVLVNPGFPSETAAAYRLLDEFRAGASFHANSVEAAKDFSPEALYGHPRNWPFRNDFLPVLLRQENGRVYENIFSSLEELGADFFGLTGAGSTCFGIFSEKIQAKKACNTLLGAWPFVKYAILLANEAKQC